MRSDSAKSAGQVSKPRIILMYAEAKMTDSHFVQVRWQLAVSRSPLARPCRPGRPRGHPVQLRAPVHSLPSVRHSLQAGQAHSGARNSDEALGRRMQKLPYAPLFVDVLYLGGSSSCYYGVGDFRTLCLFTPRVADFRRYGHLNRPDGIAGLRAVRSSGHCSNQLLRPCRHRRSGPAPSSGHGG